MIVPLADVSMIYIDRNILKVLTHQAAGESDRVLEGDRWWLSFLNDSRYRLNPLFACVEGDRRRQATYEEFRSGMDRAYQRLISAFPVANVVRYAGEDLKMAYDTISTFVTHRSAESRFLLKVAPLITQRAKRRELRGLEDTILSAASKEGVLRSRFLLLAVLSCLYEHPGSDFPSIGRGIIRPTLDYQAHQAYNAVADIQALEFLVLAIALARGDAGFVTRDRSLTRLWLASCIDDVRLAEDAVVGKLKPTAELFGALSEEDQSALMQRLEAMPGSNLSF